MKKELERRLSALEAKETDWISGLREIDYLNGLEDYDENEWEQVFSDDFTTVIRSRETGQVKGVYCDRRSHQQILDSGGSLEYL